MFARCLVWTRVVALRVQGFGHARLDNVLPLDKSFDTFMFDMEAMGSTVDAYAFKPKGGSRRLDVTLTWQDPPGPL